MSKRYMDWTDWAGDHHEELYAAYRQQSETRTSCEHEDISNQGVCTDCGDEVEGWEPSDAQIPGTYEIQSSAA